MADRYIPEHRRTQFKAKNTFKPEELRRRREEQQVEIRKAKREENLAKRRGITGGDGSRPGASLGAEPDSDDDTAPTESQVSWQHTFVTFPAGQHISFTSWLLLHGTVRPWVVARRRYRSVFTPQWGSREILFFACVDGQAVMVHPSQNPRKTTSPHYVL